MLSAVTVGAVSLGAALGIVPSATADPSQGGARPLVVDIVGDSYLAGDGIADTYLDPADLRHRSLVSPALQALSRVAAKNPGLHVDANVVTSAGAATADYFNAQQGVDDQGREAIVNTAQHDQIRPNAQAVIVSFGGTDAELAEVLAIAKPSNSSMPGDLDVKIKNLGGLLDASAPDQTYLAQVSASRLGDAPTLVSRMLQVLGGISNRAPNARIIVTNYPLAVDPEDPRSTALLKKRDLVTVQKFVLDLNETIGRAVEICVCANLVDLANALDGHEVYTEDSAYAEPAAGEPHPEALWPNDEGAALMAGPLARELALLLGIRPPVASDGKVTVPENVTIRSGESDVDGDLVPDFQDEAPEDPNNHREKHHRPDRARPHGDDPGGHRNRSPEREHVRPGPRRATDWGATPDTTLPGTQDVLGTGQKGTNPTGNLPVQILPPPAPKPRSDADELPEDKAVAEPESAERKPPRTNDDKERPAGETPVRPESGAEEAELDDAVGLAEAARDRAEKPSTVDTEGAAEAEPGEATKPAGGHGFGRAGDEVEPPLAERAPAAEEPVGEEPPEQVPWRSGRIAEAVEAEPAAEEAAEEPVGEPVAEAPGEAVHRPGQPVDEATDGQQVCVLIYPAPAGCGASEPEGSSS